MKRMIPAAVMLLMWAGAVSAGTKMVNGVEVRDWEAIDTNRDHSISPEEMKQFLEAQWAKPGKGDKK